MLSNLVLAGLVLSLSSLTSSVRCDSRADESSAFESLNKYLTDKIDDFDVKVNLELIKELVNKDSHAENHAFSPMIGLAQLLAELDADKPCSAPGLAALRRSVEIIQASEEDAFKGKKLGRRLSKVIHDFNLAAREQCFKGLELSLTEKDAAKLTEKFGHNVKNFGQLDRGFRARGEYSTFEAALKRMKKRKIPLLAGYYVRNLFDEVNGGNIEEDQITDGGVQLSQQDAEFLITQLLVEPCEEFSREPVVQDVIKPVVDLAAALDFGDNYPSELTMPWASSFMTCELLMNVDKQKLAKTVVRSSVPLRDFE